MISVGQFSLQSYLPSLPAISEHFNVNHSQIQLTLTVFLFGVATSQIIYGPISDIFGRRNVILTGLSIFLCGVVICLCSTSILMLAVGRFTSGLGAGASSALKRAVASDLFQNYRLAKAGATQSNATLITMLLAPVVGGYVQAHFGWRANFFVLFIYTTLVFILIAQFLPNTNDDRNPMDFNFTSLIKNYSMVICYHHFYRNTFYSSCSFAGMVVFTQLSSLLFITNFSVTAAQYGHFMMLIALGYLFSGLFVNQFVRHFGMFRLLTTGLMIGVCSGVILLSAVMLKLVNVPIILVAALMFVIGARIAIPNAIARCVSPLPHLSGYVSSSIGIAQTGVAAIASFVVSQLPFSNITVLTCAYLTLSITPLLMLFVFDKDEQLQVGTMRSMNGSPENSKIISI